MSSVLSNFTLFEGLEPNTQAQIYAQMEEVSVKGGNYLFREGDSSEAIYFLVKGECEVRKNTDEQDVPVARIKAGRVLGEMSLMSTGRRSASVFFHKEAQLLFWAKDKFMTFIRSNTPAGVTILLGLCEIIARRMVVRDEELKKSDPSGSDPGELTVLRRKLLNDWAI